MSSRRFLVVPALVAGALVAQAGLAGPAHAAGQRYASPTGSGSACSSAAPCSLTTAINGAGSSTEVIVAPGTYDTGATDLSNSQFAINVHGVAGQPRPVINSFANNGLKLTGSGARVADLTINHTGGSFGLNVFTSNITVQRVEVHSTGPVACFFGYSGLARDSVCTDTAADGVAVDDSWGGGGTLTTGTVTLRNITAIATGTTSYGIRADGSDFANLDINARNVIASGTKADFRATRTANSSDSDITITNSNYDLTEGAGNGVTITVADSNTNQTAQPVFADNVSYHQRLGSPTIDQGGSDAGVGTSDLDGSPRKIGLAVDIGADEFDPTPPDVAFDHTPKRKTHKHKSFFTFHSSESSTFICFVDKRPARPCVSPFKVKFKKRGKHTVTVVATDAVGNVDATPASYTWKIKKKKKRRHGHHHRHTH